MKPSTPIAIAGLKFIEAKALAPHGAPCVRFTQPKSGAVLVFNAAQVTALPDFAKARRVKVFFAEGTKLAMALFPCGGDEGTALLVDGDNGSRRKLKGACLERLSPYAKVDFRVESITEPAPGWLLTATTSERKA